jgi:hypothetical protein
MLVLYFRVRKAWTMLRQILKVREYVILFLGLLYILHWLG